MALNYTLKRSKITDGGEEIATVRGLSLNDITSLVNANADAMEALFNQFNGRDPSGISSDEITRVGLDFLRGTPSFMAQIIAIGTDAYEGEAQADGDASPMDIILAMPMGLQLEILEKIGEMTFTSNGGPKKVVALALKAMQALSQSGAPSA